MESSKMSDKEYVGGYQKICEEIPEVADALSIQEKFKEFCVTLDFRDIISLCYIVASTIAAIVLCAANPPATVFWYMGSTYIVVEIFCFLAASIYTLVF